MAYRLVLVSLVLFGCQPNVYHRGLRDGDLPTLDPDAGPPGRDSGPSDAGPLSDSLTLSVDYGAAACADLSEAAAAPDYIARFAIEGPPATDVEIWAARPHCGVAPFLFRTVATDANGAGDTLLENAGTAACGDGLEGDWIVWAAAGGVRSADAAVVIAHADCGLSCATASDHCPRPPPTGGDAGIDAGSLDGDAGPPAFDAGSDGGSDGGPPATDAGPAGGEVTLLSRPGCFFTPSTGELFQRFGVGDVGTVYERVEIAFDVVAGPWQPHIPDPSNRTEHILFGFARANQSQSAQRYLMGASAVTFTNRAPHFRMYGRDELAPGAASYNQTSATYNGWSEGTRYGVVCSIDALVQEARCELSTGGSVVATRVDPVEYLDAAAHLSTAFDLDIGADHAIDHDHLQSPRGWDFCDLRVSALPR